MTVAPSLAQQIPDLFTVHPSEQKAPDQNGSKGLATARSPCRCDLQPSGLSDALHPPHNSLEEQRPGWQQNVAQGGSAMSRPQQNAKKPTMKEVLQENGWLCGCLGGSVVSKLTSYQECLISTLLTFCTSLHEPVWVSCCFLPQF